MVTVKTPSAVQRAMVRSGSSYLMQSDLRPHFGLGNAVSADVEIQWPSGKKDRLTGLAADRFWTITEGTNAATPYGKK
jgi:hypothetical protein